MTHLFAHTQASAPMQAKTLVSSNALLTVLLASLTLTLSACGGGGCDPVIPPDDSTQATSSLSQGRWASMGSTLAHIAIMVPATKSVSNLAVDTLWVLAQDATTLAKLKVDGAVQTPGAVTGKVYTVGTDGVTVVSSASYSSQINTTGSNSSQQISIQPLFGTTTSFELADTMSVTLGASQANGRWQADLGAARVNWTIDTIASNVNNFNGTSTTGCTYSGQSTVVNSQSLYKVQFTETCSGATSPSTQTFAGIGTLSPDNTRLTVVATNGDESRAAALLFVKQP